MKKLLLGLLTGAVIFAGGCTTTAPAPTPTPTATPSPTPTQTATDTSWTDIQTKGKIVIGLDDTFAPMGFVSETGDLAGIDIEIATILCENLGIEPEFKSIDWSSKEQDLNSKKIDCIWNGFTITDARKKEVLFSDPYLSSEQLLVVNPDSTIATKADLADKIVGLQKGSTSKDALEKDKATFDSLKEVKEYEDNVQVLLDLAAGRVDAAVIDEVFVKYYIVEKEADYVVLDESFGKEDYGVGMRLADKELAKQINEALAELEDDGTIESIKTKWLR